MKLLFARDGSTKNPLMSKRFVFQKAEERPKITVKTSETLKKEITDSTTKKRENLNEEVHERQTAITNSAKEQKTLNKEVKYKMDESALSTLGEQQKKSEEKVKQQKKLEQYIENEIKPHVDNFQNKFGKQLQSIAKSNPEQFKTLKRAILSGDQKVFDTAYGAFLETLEKDPEINQLLQKQEGYCERWGQFFTDWEGDWVEYDVKKALASAGVSYFIPNLFTDIKWSKKAIIAGVMGAISGSEMISKKAWEFLGLVTEGVTKTALLDVPGLAINFSTDLITGEIWKQIENGYVPSSIFPSAWGGGKTGMQRARERALNKDFYTTIKEQPEWNDYMPNEFKSVYDKIDEYKNGQISSSYQQNMYGQLIIPIPRREKVTPEDADINEAAKLFVQSMEHINISEMVLTPDQAENLKPTAYVSKMRKNLLSLYSGGIYQFFAMHEDKTIRDKFWKSTLKYARTSNESGIQSLSMEKLFGEKLNEETIEKQRTGIDRFMFQGPDGNAVQLVLIGSISTWLLSIYAVGIGKTVQGIKKKKEEIFSRNNNNKTETPSTAKWNAEKVKPHIKEGDFENFLQELKSQKIITSKEYNDLGDKYKEGGWNTKEGRLGTNRKEFMEKVKNDKEFLRQKTVKSVREKLMEIDHHKILAVNYYETLDNFYTLKTKLADIPKKQTMKGSVTFTTEEGTFTIKEIKRSKKGNSINGKIGNKDVSLTIREKEGEIQIKRTMISTKRGNAKNLQDWKVVTNIKINTT